MPKFDDVSYQDEEYDMVHGTVHAERCDICHKALMHGPEPVRVSITTENMIPIFSHLECVEKARPDPSDMQEAFLNESQAIEADSDYGDIQDLFKGLNLYANIIRATRDNTQGFDDALTSFHEDIYNSWREHIDPLHVNLEEKINVWREKH